MGLFSLSQRYNQVEQGLLELYTSMFSAMFGISEAETRKMAKTMINEAIQNAKKEGIYNFPTNLGDIILGEAETNDPKVRKYIDLMKSYLPELRAEGVRDADIKWWSNRTDVERHMMGEIDTSKRMAFIKSFLEESGKEFTKASDEDLKEAMAELRKVSEIYAHISEIVNRIDEGDDRPLPFELKNRINTYQEK